MTFAEHLLKLRKESRQNQEELASAAGINLKTYQRYERGEREPQLSTLVALADFYGISVDELICHTPGRKKAGAKKE